MNQIQIKSAARFLIDRRNHRANRDRLAFDLRPMSNDDALAIQKATMELIGDEVGGWKTVLPVGDILNIAPIFSSNVHGASHYPVRFQKNICRIEPEIGFRFKKDLPVRDSAYSDKEIKDSLAGAHMVLELIENRYHGDEEVTYLENLADCLFNQGLYVGPEIPLEKAINSPELDFVLTQGESKIFKGKHPNNGPLLPVLWIANFLREQGVGIKSGQVVTTGSFAGVHEVQAGSVFTIVYVGVGEMKIKF
ncbi:MAG: hydratase [Gammaproteobacteria bacterium]|nr:hydratase [Gammaproteobacteria bacterium]MDH5650647.1 hydratase [Gammaproteobacteria bacterium]